MKNIRFIFLDIDGVMTDGGIYYDNQGRELKKFNTRDAAGIKAALAVGIEIVVVTGRESFATEKRLTELGVKRLFQNVKDKEQFVDSFLSDQDSGYEEIAYIADDLNDYSPMKKSAFKACPFDACDEIKNICDYVSPVFGGQGAVRDIIKYILEKQGVWDFAIEKSYGIGI